MVIVLKWKVVTVFCHFYTQLKCLFYLGFRFTTIMPFNCNVIMLLHCNKRMLVAFAFRKVCLLIPFKFMIPYFFLCLHATGYDSDINLGCLLCVLLIKGEKGKIQVQKLQSFTDQLDFSWFEFRNVVVFVKVLQFYQVLL